MNTPPIGVTTLLCEFTADLRGKRGVCKIGFVLWDVLECCGEDHGRTHTVLARNEISFPIISFHFVQEIIEKANFSDVPP